MTQVEAKREEEAKKGCKSSGEVNCKEKEFIAGLLGFSGVAEDITAKLPI